MATYPIWEPISKNCSPGFKNRFKNAISISEYLKQKEKPRIKKLNLDAVAPGKALSELTDAEREVVRNLLRMTFGQD